MAKLHFRPYSPNQTVLFPQRIDENIAANDPVRIVNAVIDNLNLESFKKLYKETGRCPYHPKMMLKVIIYAYKANPFPDDGTTHTFPSGLFSEYCLPHFLSD